MPVIELQLKLQESRNNVFKSKERTNKYYLIYLRGFELLKKVWFMFWWQVHSMNGECYVFSDYKQINNKWLVFLACKLQEDSSIVDAFSS